LKEGFNVPNKKIDEISIAVEELKDKQENIEKIFELGVELGKHIALSGEKYKRLPFFVTQGQEKNREGECQKELEKIKEAVRRLLYFALAEQIKKHQLVSISVTHPYDERLQLLDGDISEKYSIRCKSVSQKNAEQDFELKCEVIGEIGKIFSEYDTRPDISFFVINNFYTEKEEFDDAEKLNACLLTPMFIAIDEKSPSYDPMQLEKFSNALGEHVLIVQLTHFNR